MTTSSRRLHLTLDDQVADRYLEVPFDVGDHQAVEVTLTYDREAAVVDLGCTDPERWRGWSGSSRERFAITPTAATQGYEPGELPRGEWAVVLGLHNLPDEGIDVEVTITTSNRAGAVMVENDPAPPPRPENPRASSRDLPAPEGLTWFAGDFHSHSLHSDGDLSLDELSEQAALHGLDFLAVTEHNTVSHHPHLPAVGERYDITLLPGQEVTTHRGHANAFGEIGWIDFREPADRWVQEVAARGGLLSINHPLEGDCSWQHPLSELPPALELWHIGWFRDLKSEAPWALWPLWRRDAILLGGSDFHHHRHNYLPGTPTTWVAATDRSPTAILEATVAGRTAITMLPGAGSPTLLRVGDELIAVDADGSMLVDIEGRSRTVHGDRQVFRADSPADVGGVPGAGTAPYRLEAADRTLFAICP